MDRDKNREKDDKKEQDKPQKKDKSVSLSEAKARLSSVSASAATTRLSSGGEQDASRGSRWGWNKNRAIDVGRVSRDINIEKRKSGGFGTAPVSEYDYSILHSHKRYSFEPLGQPIEEEEEKSEEPDASTSKVTTSYIWKKENETQELKATEGEGIESRKDSVKSEAGSVQTRPEVATVSEPVTAQAQVQKQTVSQAPVAQPTPTVGKPLQPLPQQTVKPLPPPSPVVETVKPPPSPAPAIQTVKPPPPPVVETIKSPPPPVVQTIKSPPPPVVQTVKPSPVPATQGTSQKQPAVQAPKQPLLSLPSQPASQTSRPLAPPQPAVQSTRPPASTQPTLKPAKALPPTSSSVIPPTKLPVTSIAPPISKLSTVPYSASESESELNSTAQQQHGRAISKPKRRRRPKPSEHEEDLDDDIAFIINDDGTVSRTDNRKRVSLNIYDDGREKHPDDELLFSLTAREELVFRRSLSGMRWEEEQESMTDTEYTGTSSDAESAAADILWERVTASKNFEIPKIVVNDRRISLAHLDPDPEMESDTDVGMRDTYQNIFSNKISDGDNNSSDENIFKELESFINEAQESKRRSEQDESKKSSVRAKLWRRRLIVVVLLNFLMKFRRRFNTFCEIVVPVVVCGVVVSGMIWNSDGTLIAIQQEIEDKNAGVFDPFEKIAASSIYTSFCSNAEFCGQKSKRHYYIVFSPQNNFTDDIMERTIRILMSTNEVPSIKRKGGSTSHVPGAPIHPSHLVRQENEVSQLIGVDSAMEVERECHKHWRAVSKYDDENDERTPQFYEGEESYLKENHNLIRYPIGVIFSMEANLIGAERRKRIEANEDIPKTLAYTVRTFFPELANTVEGFPFREHLLNKSKGKTGQSHFGSTPYLHTGVIGLQLALDMAFAEKIVEKSEKVDPNIKMGNIVISRKSFLESFKKQPYLQQFEYPTYKGKVLRVKSWLALTMTILFSYLVGDIIVAQDVIHEQNRGSIELLKIHGMTTSMRWIANLILLGVLRAVTTLAMALIIHYKYSIDAVADFSSPLFLWLFLWMHACTMTCFNYFITSGMGVRKPELAGLIVVTVCFTTMLLPVDPLINKGLSRFINIVICFLLPPWNLANGVYYYLRFEMYEEGLDWYDFPVWMDNQTHKVIALPFSCNIFLYSTIFYMLLTIYMDHILPREFSPRETWLFFLKNFTRRPPSHTHSSRPIPRSQKPSVYEPGPEESAYGPRFRNVTVTDASNNFTVLDNISLDMYEGEVTCIVGQIGSGKSDFLNVIAGVNIPSAGYVEVKGLKVHEYHDITNRYVSLCPQKRLLIEQLSVEDHIRLCCMLHGASYPRAKGQATYLLKVLGLMPYRRHSYQGLATSDIKKLMLAMALSKSPSVLLLDNPVEQLDSESRIQFWNLLQELKPHRSIVVTCTTFEEAQLYADRIGVLSKGKLVCYGSPQFLRMAYGIGNVMTLRMQDGTEPNIKAILDLIQNEQGWNGAPIVWLETKGVSLEKNTVKFIMPYGKFCGSYLEKLEDSAEKFKISKIVMSQPSLWAFYHKVATHAGIEQVLAKREIKLLRGGNPDEHEGFEKAVEPPIPVRSGKREPKTTGFSNIISILVLKKYWYYRQKYWSFLVAYLPQIILLMFVVLYCQFFLLYEPESLSKIISTRMYDNNLVVFRSADNEFTRKSWEEAFYKVIKEDDQDAEVEIFDQDDDLDAFLATGQAHTLSHYKRQTIVAFSKDKGGFVGYYSSNSLHSGPIASHVLMQAFLYLISPNSKEPYSTLLVSNPLLQYHGFPAGSTQSNSSTILGLFLSLIMCLLSAPLLRMILTERATKFKNLQKMTGVSGWMYWFSHALADFLLYAVLSMMCWGLVIFVDNIVHQEFDGWEERLALMLIFSVSLCWASLPYTYFLGCIMSTKNTGYAHYILYHFLFGIIPKVITYQFYRLWTSGVYWAVRYVLYVFPPYAITSACVHFFHGTGEERWCRKADNYSCEMYENVTKLLENGNITEFIPTDNRGTDKANISQETVHFLINEINFNDRFRTCCRPFCESAGTCHETLPFFKFDDEDEETVVPTLLHDIYALIVNGVVFWIVLILHELHIMQMFWAWLVNNLWGNLEQTVAQRDVKASDEPEDVKVEHVKVDYMVEIEGDVDSEVYLVQDVTKFYKYVKGLNHIFFSVPKNAITGILGLPKSGKTTILDILTCQIAPSSGYVYKDNDLLDMRRKRSLIANVGYCPQTSCLLGYLTGTQMLTVMGRLRGLSTTECEQHVLWWMQLFELQDVANKRCRSYKKGQEALLCCALALIGDTKTVIFDECTAPMDSIERYTFWNVISRLPKLARTVIFTSINADEVTHLSNKAMLIESGSLVAVGHLTEIFKNNNQGLTLALRYKIPPRFKDFQRREKIDKLKEHVILYLSPCALVNEQENLLFYHLKDQNLKLSKVFAVMEGAKVKFPTLLEHFEVFEPSLDDIILQFHKSRMKRGERQSGLGGSSKGDESSTTQLSFKEEGLKPLSNY